MMNPLISIVMPVKNAGEFLSSCICSIIDQFYENWELIAVDDHSSDDSLEVLKKYSLQDDRIYVYKNQGNGIIDGLKTAFQFVKGTFITRMDADDLMMKDKLWLMLQSLMSHGRGYIAVGGVCYFSKNQLGEGYINYAKWLNQLTVKGNNFKDIYKECVIPSPCWMVDIADFKNAGGFNSNVYPEDYDLAFRFYKSGLIVIPTTNVLHLWRDYTTRTSRTDENYADNSFIPLKCSYFLKLHYDKDRALMLLGAGKKGKSIAKNFVERNISFSWWCNNPNKIGKEIYGKKLLPFDTIDNYEKSQCIIAFTDKHSQHQLKDKFKNLSLVGLKDYFFFC